MWTKNTPLQPIATGAGGSVPRANARISLAETCFLGILWPEIRRSRVTPALHGLRACPGATRRPPRPPWAAPTGRGRRLSEGPRNAIFGRKCTKRLTILRYYAIILPDRRHASGRAQGVHPRWQASISRRQAALETYFCGNLFVLTFTRYLK